LAECPALDPAIPTCPVPGIYALAKLSDVVGVSHARSSILYNADLYKADLFKASLVDA
jgi:hypothetical protein